MLVLVLVLLLLLLLVLLLFWFIIALFCCKEIYLQWTTPIRCTYELTRKTVSSHDGFPAGFLARSSGTGYHIMIFITVTF